MAALAILGGNIERVAVELRHLQRTEVLEAQEPFHEGQTGSSSMPHKKNPVGLENLTGVARLLRGYLFPALEDIALWHERDISHSSVERVILPDATTLAHYALRRLKGILEGLGSLKRTWPGTWTSPGASSTPSRSSTPSSPGAFPGIRPTPSSSGTP